MTLWPSFWDRVEEHAQNHGVSTDEIKIVGPSIASKDSAMRWGEDFYLNLPENIRIDAINVHEYNINGGQQGVNCNCEPKLLRDTLSHYRFDWNLFLRMPFLEQNLGFQFGWSSSIAATAGGTVQTSNTTNT